jgi:hypothetical protein
MLVACSQACSRGRLDAFNEIFSGSTEPLGIMLARR